MGITLLQSSSRSRTLFGIYCSRSFSFFDAISDPLVGVWSDRFKSKLGIRHPFIYASIFPLAFCIWLLFVPPSSYDQTYLFLKLLTLTVCIRLAITFFETPRAALGPELTKDYDRRNTLNAMGLFFGYGGAILIGFVMLEFFLPETSGYMGSRAYLNPEGYEKLAWVLLDYIDAIVHVFKTQEREYYDIERLWADAPKKEFNYK